jgi:putative endopeptidase
MKKRRLLSLFSLCAAAVLLLSGCVQPVQTEQTVQTAGQAEQTEKPSIPGTGAVRLQDDFYEAVNADWLADTVLPASMPMVGTFGDLSDQVEKQLMDDFAIMQKGELKADSSELSEFLKLYAMASDYTTRNRQGAQPLLPYLDKISRIENLDQLDLVLRDWVLEGIPTPFSFSVQADMKEATANALYAHAPALFLQDVSYYGTKQADEQLALFEQTIQKLLVLAGQTGEQASLTAEQAVEFDKMLVPYIKTAEEASDEADAYNPVSVETFGSYSKYLHLGKLVTSLTDAPKQVIVSDPKFFAVFDKLINKDTFPLLKSWITTGAVYSMAPKLSEDFLQTAYAFAMQQNGETAMDDKQKLAYQLASNSFSEVIGAYYGRTYFGADAKNDVTGLVNNIIQIYIRRLPNNDWLSRETIQAAIKKLNAMSIHIGYPDKIPPAYSRMKVLEPKDGGSVLGNVMAFGRIQNEDMFAKVGAPVDKSAWSFSADTVNAKYDVESNTITFPAAILQAPFYSLKQTDSRNYGGIGAVIAHEVTHAFDSNGAKFDGDGNLVNWWMDADYKAFEGRTQAMVQEFDVLSFAGGTVNGKLTVTENTADAGGLSCALEAVKALPGADLKAFFENWATIWRTKETPEVEKLLLAQDVHAPAKLRVNIQLENLDDFYSTFGIKEGDGMYLPPEKRVSIW